jgi:hypothetical protein
MYFFLYKGDQNCTAKVNMIKTSNMCSTPIELSPRAGRLLTSFQSLINEGG